MFGVIDKIDRQPRDVSREKLVASGHVGRTRSTRFSRSWTSRRSTSIERPFRRGSPACTSASPRFGATSTCLDGLGVLEWVTIDLTIVRGLAYYTGIVFELFDAKGELRAICGGGRYDTLLQSLGGVDLPALGFGMGDVVLAELLRERGLLPARVAAAAGVGRGGVAVATGATCVARRRRCGASA